MNRFSLQKKAVTSCDEMAGLVSIHDPKGPVVCPKPRRVGSLVNSSIRPIRWHVGYQADNNDLKAGADLLDIILMKEGHGAELAATQVASSPPFFCGSPPARASNPLTEDARFGDEKITPMSPLSIPSPSSPTASSRTGGGCVRKKYGLKPAAVRVEGFNCLTRDRRSSSIPATA